MAISERYMTLITSEHANKPKFRNMVQGLLSMVDDVYNLAAFWDSSFDIDYAIGVQLDILGDIVGRSRELEVEIDDVYFTFDVEGLGWDEGVWRGPYDPVNGLSLMPDDIYRLILKSKIAANVWNGSIPEAYTIYDIAFAQLGAKIIVQDHQDMSMAVGVIGLPDTPINRALLKMGYMFTKPEGVRIQFYMYTPDPGVKLFVWDGASDRVGGWDTGAWGAILHSE